MSRVRGRVWPAAPAAYWGAGTTEGHEWGSVFHVPSVSRGVINNHCPWTSRTSRCHGTPRTSRDPRSVCLLALPPVSSMGAMDSNHIGSNPYSKGRN